MAEVSPGFVGSRGSVGASTVLVEGVGAATGPELVTNGLDHGGVEHADQLRGCPAAGGSVTGRR